MCILARKLSSFAQASLCLPAALSADFPMHDLGAALFYGIVVSGLGWRSYSRGAASISPTKLPIVIMPEAILSPPLVASLIDEVPGPIALLGSVLVFASVSWYSLANAAVP